MDAIVELVRSAPVSSSQQTSAMLSKLNELLGKGGKKAAGAVERMLQEGVLSPAQGHAAACAELLAHRIAHGGPLTGEFVDAARLVLSGLPARDVALVGRAVTTISRQLTKLLLQAGGNATIRGIKPLKDVLNAITAACPSVVTSVHTDLLLLTLKSHAYDLLGDAAFLSSSSACASLSRVDPAVWPIETVDYLQCFYYLGMHHSALQHFEQAAEAFQLVLSAPNAGAVSAVQIEAYKKLVLVNLLANGEAPSLNQRLSAPILLRYIDTLAAPYSDLAKAYRKCVSGSGSGGAGSAHAELTHLVEAHAETFLQDRNLGLVKQILNELPKKQITRLTQTYITCSMDDVAAHMAVAAPLAAAQQPAAPAVAAAKAERKVFDMICAGEVHARLDASARMVHFLDDPEEYDDGACIARLDGRIQEITALNAALAERERELQVSPAYLMRVMRGGGGGGAGPAGNDAMDMAMARGLSLHDADVQSFGGAQFAEDDDLQRAMQQSLMDQ